MLQRHGAKPLPLRLSVTKGSPCGRAPAIAGERVIVAIIRPLRRLRRHLSQRERLFVSPIITQIGRENNRSAEICILRVAEDVDPYKHCVKHPCENEPNATVFFAEGDLRWAITK